MSAPSAHRCAVCPRSFADRRQLRRHHLLDHTAAVGLPAPDDLAGPALTPGLAPVLLPPRTGPPLDRAARAGVALVAAHVLVPVVLVAAELL